MTATSSMTAAAKARENAGRFDPSRVPDTDTGHLWRSFLTAARLGWLQVTAQPQPVDFGRGCFCLSGSVSLRSNVNASLLDSLNSGWVGDGTMKPKSTLIRSKKPDAGPTSSA